MDTSIFTAEIIQKIADDVSCGLTAFVNLDTGEYQSYTEMGLNEIDFYDEDIDWQRQEKEAYENMQNWEHRAEIEPMESSEAYQVMEDFIYEFMPEKSADRREFLTAISKKQPFSHFNALIHPSEYREEWFKFRLERYKLYVKEWVERELDFLQEEEEA